MALQVLLLMRSQRLQSYGFVGTDYVITQCVGMTTAPNTCHANTSATYMTWAQIAQLKQLAGKSVLTHRPTRIWQAAMLLTASQTYLRQHRLILNSLAQNLILVHKVLTLLTLHLLTATGLLRCLPKLLRRMLHNRGFADNIDQNAEPNYRSWKHIPL